MSSGFSCFDVNECEDFDTGQRSKNDSEIMSHQKSHNCPQYSECINTYAGYQCACYDGFLLFNGTCQVCLHLYHVIFSMTKFQDVDECDGGAVCPENSNCINTLGEYICECDSGLGPCFASD